MNKGLGNCFYRGELKLEIKHTTLDPFTNLVLFLIKNRMPVNLFYKHFV